MEKTGSKSQSGSKEIFYMKENPEIVFKQIHNLKNSWDLVDLSATSAYSTVNTIKSFKPYKSVSTSEYHSSRNFTTNNINNQIGKRRLVEDESQEHNPPRKKQLFALHEKKKENMPKSISELQPLDLERSENGSSIVLDSMDVDDVFTATICNQTKDLVIDTNVLMHQKSYLENIQGQILKNWQIKIIIPYVVIQELDVLKNKRESETGSLAQAAIRWCNKHFELQNSDVKGQTYEEYFDVFYLYDDKNLNDDHIRNTCLYYKNRGRNVFLISDDINLRNKALLSNIDALPSKKLPEIVKNLSTPQHKISIDAPFKKSSKTDIGRMPSQLIDRIRFSLTSTLSDILQHHLEDIYGDIWKQIVIEKPPWDVKKLQKCFTKHWIALFISEYENNMKILIENALRMLMNIKNLPSIESAINATKKLYSALEKTNDNIYIKKCDFDFVEPNTDQEMEVLPSISNLGSQTYVNVKSTILGILQYSHNIMNNCLSHLDEPSQQSHFNEDYNNAKSSVLKLQDFLKSFGYSILSLKQNPSIQSAEKFQSLIRQFWREAHLDDTTSFSMEEIGAIASTCDGLDFLESYVKELEKLIQHSQKFCL